MVSAQEQVQVLQLLLCFSFCEDNDFDFLEGFGFYFWFWGFFVCLFVFCCCSCLLFSCGVKVSGVTCLVLTLAISFRKHACPGDQNICEHEILIENKVLFKIYRSMGSFWARSISLSVFSLNEAKEPIWTQFNKKNPLEIWLLCRKCQFCNRAIHWLLPTCKLCPCWG